MYGSPEPDEFLANSMPVASTGSRAWGFGAPIAPTFSTKQATAVCGCGATVMDWLADNPYDGPANRRKPVRAQEQPSAPWQPAAPTDLTEEEQMQLAIAMSQSDLTSIAASTSTSNVSSRAPEPVASVAHPVDRTRTRPRRLATWGPCLLTTKRLADEGRCGARSQPSVAASLVARRGRGNAGYHHRKILVRWHRYRTQSGHSPAFTAGERAGKQTGS